VDCLALTSASPSQTRRIGARLGRRLRAGDVVLLLGDLGTGKTVLAQGIGRGMGVTDPVKSSSFVLVNEYRGRLKLYHADLYRLSDATEVADLALEESAADGVLVVEWPDRALEELPREHLLVRLDWQGERGRRLTFQATGPRYGELVADLARRRRGAERLGTS
jgi:tRNA threonylcarbamoyladenosine biosynthesis protein TsaE